MNIYLMSNYINNNELVSMDYENKIDVYKLLWKDP